VTVSWPASSSATAAGGGGGGGDGNSDDDDSAGDRHGDHVNNDGSGIGAGPSAGGGSRGADDSGNEEVGDEEEDFFGSIDGEEDADEEGLGLDAMVRGRAAAAAAPPSRRRLAAASAASAAAALPEGAQRIFTFVQYEESAPLELDGSEDDEVPFNVLSVSEADFSAAEAVAAADQRGAAAAAATTTAAPPPPPPQTPRGGLEAPEWARPGLAVLPAGVPLPPFSVVDRTPEPRVMDWRGGDVEWATVPGESAYSAAAAAAAASASASASAVAAAATVAQRVRHEAFSLRIVYEAGRTGFEEEKEFEAAVGSVIAGRYRVMDYIGSAAFSSALSCTDLVTGDDVCLKVIKNSKDFLDQSLDEIKLLRYINAQGDADAHNILRLREYFYHKEHLFIVTELLKDNLYEFGKYLADNGHEPFFTLPRIQRIAVQTLRALAFIHARGLLHCECSFPGEPCRSLHFDALQQAPRRPRDALAARRYPCVDGPSRPASYPSPPPISQRRSQAREHPHQELLALRGQGNRLWLELLCHGPAERVHPVALVPRAGGGAGPSLRPQDRHMEPGLHLLRAPDWPRALCERQCADDAGAHPEPAGALPGAHARARPRRAQVLPRAARRLAL
jgi:hypothetical protein